MGFAGGDVPRHIPKTLTIEAERSCPFPEILPTRQAC
jgi:hypothetical protein